VAVGVGVEPGAGDVLGVGDPDGPGDGDPDGLGDGDPDGLGDGEPDGDGEGDPEGIGLGDCDGDGDGDGDGVDDVHGGKLPLFVVVPRRLAMSLDANSTRSVLKPGWTNEDTFMKQPVYVVVPGTIVNISRAPVSTKSDELGVCPVSSRVIVPATGLSTVRVTQTWSAAQS
jgi:hypothetical protein